MRQAILAFIDFFYPPFKKFISQHNFRYLATGGSAAALGIIVYTLAYKYVFLQSETEILGMTIKRNTAALIADFAIAIPYSFLMNRYVIFTHSEVKGRIQLLRFLNLNFINILLTTILLKFFSEILNIYPTVSRVIVTVLIAGFSYLYQHYFTFSVKKVGGKKDIKKH
ncbi:GtrA family protein [Pedobacter paludis]|uniref:Phenylalanine 4-monooxygenase n=1 Tax=Pedobacter paludis TaxID=2203212 RepID=A0A317F1L2_9SPHI|nr:GtrA family protein [Pedobacter paludis]PWS31338.1 phenylalanine 4-monooxygenase [Pedobacter paludis]